MFFQNVPSLSSSLLYIFYHPATQIFVKLFLFFSSHWYSGGIYLASLQRYCLLNIHSEDKDIFGFLLLFHILWSKNHLAASPNCFLTCLGEEPKFSLSILVGILMDASVVSLHCDKQRKSRSRTHCVGLQAVLMAAHP